jgi:hypothetical protein
MKKLSVFGLVIVLLAFSVMPVLAAKPNNSGGGNGSDNGQGNRVSQQARANAQDQQQDKLQTQNQDRLQVNHPANEGHGNQASMRMRTPFYLQGTISSINSPTGTLTSTVTQTLTIEVIHGNAQLKSYIGSTLQVNLTGTTQFYKINQLQKPEGTEPVTTTMSTPSLPPLGNRLPITFADLAVNDIVAIHGNVVAGVFNATLITVYVRTPVSQPETPTP